MPFTKSIYCLFLDNIANALNMCKKSYLLQIFIDGTHVTNSSDYSFRNMLLTNHRMISINNNDVITLPLLQDKLFTDRCFMTCVTL